MATSVSSTSYGALGTPTTGVEARVYYEGNYYDLANRLTANVNVGTNGGTAWSMPGSVPSRSATALVTTYGYAADAVQTVKLTGTVTGGTFTLTFGGYTTSSIAYNASASTVQSDLATLTSIGSGNVVVTQVVDGGWEVRFTGSLAGTYQNQMTANSSGLTGTSPGVALATTSLGGDAGNVVDTTDPDDIDTRTYSDPLGRAVQTIQDFTNGAVTDDSNQTTDYTYNSVGQTSLTAELTGGVGETTAWLYGVTTGTGSDIDSNDIVGVTEQPNPTTGLQDSSIKTTVTVDALGDTLTSTDPDGTTHTYAYDVLGQQTSDGATTLGTGVDGSIRLITTSYTTLGNPYLITSYSAISGGSVVNQVENVFNGLDQFTQQYQSVSGSVNTSSTPSIKYIYNDLSGGANNSRLTEIIYPDGYTVNYNYSSGLDSSISRLSSISDDTGTLQSYQYLGLYTIVEMDEPEADVDLTYISTDDGTGSGGDQYVGLDQFGRVVNQNWYSTSTDSSIVNLSYGYDNDGNVFWEIDGVDSSLGSIYNYDNLGQVTVYEQGDVEVEGPGVGLVGTPTIDETWNYDALGNHLQDSTTTTGTTTINSTFNYDNQIASIGSGTTPIYDSDGNMTTDQNDLKYTYNAWGEVVTVKNSSGTTLESYTYDGVGDRMTNTVSGTATNLYYSLSGQVLEEQVASSGDYTLRYVWTPNLVNQMVSRDNDTSGSGLTPTGSSYTRLFALNDANYNVVALANTSGSVVERYEYDPYGTRTILTGSYGSRGSSSYNWIYGFQGGREDMVSGDTIFGARNTNPDLGTWTSEDPMGFGGGDNDLYGFEDNSPVDNTDPTGLQVGAGNQIGWYWGDPGEAGDGAENGGNGYPYWFPDYLRAWWIVAFGGTGGKYAEGDKGAAGGGGGSGGSIQVGAGDNKIVASGGGGGGGAAACPDYGNGGAGGDVKIVNPGNEEVLAWYRGGSGGTGGPYIIGKNGGGGAGGTLIVGANGPNSVSGMPGRVGAWGGATGQGGMANGGNGGTGSLMGGKDGSYAVMAKVVPKPLPGGAGSVGTGTAGEGYNPIELPPNPNPPKPNPNPNPNPPKEEEKNP